MSLSLSQRLQALENSYKETVAQIKELRKFSAATYTSGDPDERRVELATEIHDSLKEQEDKLEELRQDLDNASIPRSRRGTNLREDEHERNADLVLRLTEDLKSARANFRRAQLQAKRTADEEKRKEREKLFADRKQDGQAPPRVRSTHEKLTQDELAMRAAEDVTIALRRVHNQLEGELSTSQFAQQTLEESQQALNSLATSYAGTTDLLKASRGFVGQLVRSNKSDTWFLKTSFYLLAVTIAWLFYRRIIYGPMMLFIVWPLKLMWWMTFSSFGILLGGKSEVSAVSAPVPTLSISMPGAAVRSMPTNVGGSQVYFKSMHLPAKGGGARGPPPEIPQNEVEDRMIDKIGRMMENQEGSYVDDISEEERQRQEAEPRNPKKRMMEFEPVRDEL
ncbi:Protein transport protein sec20 [Cladophialophora chaetospira]|uniref:Protein transport protein sec20 n=1 Tax=Cladophialophora chaetospira TaxID=386627 RepID=A0AA38XLT6_9EURO|nr:Protein transport protein sec20 [Cladophialophora chaetospira]